MTQAEQIGGWVRGFQEASRTKKRQMLRDLRKGGIELILGLNAQDVPWTPRDTFDLVIVAADVFAEELWGMRGLAALAGDAFVRTVTSPPAPAPKPCGCH